jgi:hypothetical protein
MENNKFNEMRGEMFVYFEGKIFIDPFNLGTISIKFYVKLRCTLSIKTLIS